MAHSRTGVSLTVFALAVILNYPWEMAQAFLFAPMGSVAQASWRCFIAGVGDGLMVLGIFAGGSLLYRDTMWFARWSRGRFTYTISFGLAVAIAVEWWGLSTGRWEYQGTMPRVPILDLGLVPLLQIPVLAPLTLRAAKCSTRGPSLLHVLAGPTNRAARRDREEARRHSSRGPHAVAPAPKGGPGQQDVRM